MNPQVTGAIIQGAGNVLSDLANNVAMNRNLRLQNKWNQRMADYTYSKDLEMWNRQNQYNSPGAQMQRLKEAGLNPNLVYGNGSVTGNTSSGLIRYQAPEASFNYKPMVPGIEAISGIIPLFMDLQVKQAQTDNIKANTEVANVKRDMTALQFMYDKMYKPSTEMAKAETLNYKSMYWNNKAWQSQHQAEAASIYSDNLRKFMEIQMNRMNNESDKVAQEAIYQKYKNDWARLGITQADNPLYRLGIKMLNALGFSSWTQPVNAVKQAVK